MERFFQQHDSDAGWFKVGAYQITTTIIASAVGLLSMFLWVISKSLFVIPLVLSGDSVRSGEVWRLATWPFVNEPSIWLVISVAMLFVIGSDVERRLGRGRYLWMLGSLIIIPALVGTIYPVGAGFGQSPAYGLQFLTSGLFVLLVLMMPTARSFFNIPLWVIVAAFIVITALQIVDGQDWPLLAFFFAGLVTATFAARAFDLTEFEQIPKIPLPAFITKDPYQKANRARIKQQQGKQPRPPKAGRGRKRGSATVIPMPAGGRPVDRFRERDIGALLDKISEQGIASLTPEERQRLDDHSRHLRGDS